MRNENIFCLLLILTIIISRLSVLIFPERDVILAGIVIHHYVYGIILIIISYVFTIKSRIIKTCFLGIGAGFIVDQLVFVILGGGKDKEYFQLISLISPFILTLIIFIYRSKIAKLIRIAEISSKDISIL
jgi:hypothetical protein